MESEEKECNDYFVIIQLLRLKPPCLVDICFDAKRLTSLKYPSDRALGIPFLTG
ncbi:MAG: hypothetical protein HON48_16890 [Desulfobacula sp.]|jgi:hypothetical protein|nr:hypothetical protein [Desulfobacula sp.]